MSSTSTIPENSIGSPLYKPSTHNLVTICDALRRERARYRRAAAAAAQRGPAWRQVATNYAELVAVTDARIALREVA